MTSALMRSSTNGRCTRPSREQAAERLFVGTVWALLVGFCIGIWVAVGFGVYLLLR